jgi:hypothetical protein
MSFGSQSGEPGSPSGWDQTGANFLAQRCSLINFGEETIFNMPLTFNVKFVAMSDGHSGSQIVARTSTTMLVTSLDSGRTSPFVVYILTLNRRVAVQIELPMTASYIIAGDETRKEANFLPTGTNPITLFPAADKN